MPGWLMGGIWPKQPGHRKANRGPLRHVSHADKTAPRRRERRFFEPVVLCGSSAHEESSVATGRTARGAAKEAMGKKGERESGKAGCHAKGAKGAKGSVRDG